MREVTFNGPQNALRISGSGRVLRRGDRTEVTNDEADLLADSGHDVTIHRTKSDTDENGSGTDGTGDGE
ncbi:MAG: hypothetical protein KY469_10785 [Actinobacteria bacterium]|nr:hypothetical protein [Actinomycetota bacterium]